MNRYLQAAILCLGIAGVLACNMVNTVTGEPTSDPVLAETDIALRVMATSLAGQVMTVQAAQTQISKQMPAFQPTQTSAPLQSTAENILPSPLPTSTDVPAPASLVLGIQTSVNTFYCYQSPYELTITVRVSDINKGMAVYYHIEDKISGVTSDGQVLDLHRTGSDTRSITIIGGGSMDQNLQFPPLMGESYFIYQIISDDGTFRSPVYSNVTFFPCAQ
jgi:hypothetical protein